MRDTIGIVLVGALICAGCSESTVIRSVPPGAKVYVNERFVGVTPVVFSVPSREFRPPYRCHLERDGYLPLDEPLRIRTGDGRVIGGAFSAGVSLLFRGFDTFANAHDFTLKPVLARPAEAASGPSIEDRLRRIQQLRDRGLISQEECDRDQIEILRGP